MRIAVAPTATPITNALPADLSLINQVYTQSERAAT
jgi:hypothetical protein